MSLLLELLFPPKCMLCRQLLGEEEEICGECRKKILLNTAPPRAEKGAFFDKAAAGLWYETNVRQAIHGLKYREKQNYARPLARVMVYAYQHKIGEECDLIAFVPTSIPGMNSLLSLKLMTFQARQTRPSIFLYSISGSTTSVTGSSSCSRVSVRYLFSI